MPNQRSKDKTLIGGYVGAPLKKAIAAECRRLGITETSFVEMQALRVLLASGKLTPKAVDAMADKQTLTPDTLRLWRTRRDLFNP